ncbi:unnamed protein product [Rotaria sordida]|uniref:JmjC domain-containing protein n=1 Tax=Rotaria sordida TaxID=392033 RepID=A0A815PGQ2_9BILA|nr:unnamed protein product [Rotaria sordida]
MPTIYETDSLDEAIDIVQDENKRYPFILHKFDIGACQEKWTSDYLASKIGSKPVRIHVSQDDMMDFVRKNFTYETLPFNKLIHRCARTTNDEYFVSPDEHYYFRALGDNQRTDIANIEKHFPSIANDIKYPPLFSPEKFFSSVFRIGSANTQLWTHYDIMDNVLIQVHGTKRLIMFKPSDIDYLYIDGDKSLVNNIEQPDFDTYPLVRHATYYTGTLQSGDCLFIPALWFHNIKSLDTYSISLNVFWRHLNIGFYEPQDLYGNKDLIPFSRTIGQLAKSLNELDKQLPPVYVDFYIKRLRCYLDNYIKEYEKKIEN